MARTVVGLFKSHDEAQNVKHELVNEGYIATDIRVIGKDGQAQPPGAAVSSTNESADTGLGATISNFFKSLTGASSEDENHFAEGVSTGGAFLAVTVPDNRADAAAALLERHGARNVDEQTSASGTEQSKAPTSVSSEGSAASQKLDVVQEELQVGKRQVQRGGVRVYSHVVEQPVEEKIVLREEHVHVERHQVDRAATEADFTAFKEGQIELQETAEEAVVSKKARVVEEVVIGKQITERQETIKETVRRTDVEVEKLGADNAGYSAMEPHFKQDFERKYSKGGSSYGSYAPAYKYGHRLATDPKFAKGDWTSVESAAKSDWAKQGSGSWEDMKAAVRTGWDKVRSTAKGN